MVALRALIAALIALLPAAAYPADFRVLLGDTSGTSTAIAAAIQRRHPLVETSTDPTALTSRRGSGVYIALGPAALSTATRTEAARPLLSLFVSGQSFARIAGSEDQRSRSRMTTAIYAEAAPATQMKLIKAIYVRRVTVGVLLSQATQHLVEPLQAAARAAGLDIDIRILEPNENVLHALASMAAFNVLLSIPDREIYTPDSVRLILESTYRRGQAVIGFSTDMVAAGALAAAYSDVEDVIAQMDEVVEMLLIGRWVAPQYPTYWHVAVNENVARSLNIVVDESVRMLGNRPPPR